MFSVNNNPSTTSSYQLRTLLGDAYRSVAKVKNAAADASFSLYEATTAPEKKLRSEKISTASRHITAAARELGVLSDLEERLDKCSGAFDRERIERIQAAIQGAKESYESMLEGFNLVYNS